MGHSYVDFGGHSELFADIDVIVWVRCLAAEDDLTQPSACDSSRLRAMLVFWRYPEAFPGPGCINLELDKYMEDEGSREELQSLMKKVEERIKEFGRVVPCEYLNRIKSPPGYEFHDLPSERVLNVLDRFRCLLIKGTHAAP